MVNKGNYLNIDGQCLSVKKFLRDWNTDNLYRTLQSTNDFDYINKFQSQIQISLENHVNNPLKKGQIYSKFGTGKINIPAESALAASHAFRGLTESGVQGGPDRLQSLRAGSVYKRLMERYGSFNYNASQNNGIQIEFFKNLHAAVNAHGTQENQEPKLLVDFEELNDLVELDERSAGFSKL